MMKTCRSDTAGMIRDALTMPQVASFYGFQPNRSGFIKCPFHSEKTASLKIYDDGFCCFGCGRKGSVIDFAMELFGLSFRDALARLDADFGLYLTGATIDREAVGELRRKRIRAQAKKAADEREYRLMTEEFRRTNEIVQTCVPDENGEVSDEFADAMKRLPELEYWFDTHECPY